MTANPTGRPRKIRSRPTSGVGGRPFTDPEADALRAIEMVDLYAVAVDDLMNRLWLAFSSYQADADALGKQVGLADELRDLESIVSDAKRVRQLLVDRADSDDPHGCIAPAGLLAKRLQNFPNMIAAATTGMPQGVAFMHAQMHLVAWVVRVRYWPENRAQLVGDIDLMLEVIKAVPIPAGFTKRYATARDRFEDALVAIYIDLLHPERVNLWQSIRDDRNDPPPPESGHAFARAVMNVLGVRFEVKRSKG